MPSYGELLDLFILIIILIVPFLGLLVWAGNKVTNSNEETHYFTGEEMVQTCNETYQLFEQDHEEDTLHGLVRTHCACSFCGKLSHITSVCSSCNTAFYCSEVCKDTHWRFFHKYECVDEIESAKEQQEGSPSRGTHCLLKEPEIESSKYSLFNEVVEQKTDEGEVYCIEERIEQMRYYDACAACGNASTKKCSRCKAIKYCSQTCQHSDWRSGHKFHCVAATGNQETVDNGNAIVPSYSSLEEDNAHSSDPLCLEYYSEGRTDTKAPSLSYQEATNTGQKEIEEQLKNLNEKLEKIRKENITLQSERDQWEMNARHAEDKLNSFRKENEHQLFMLKHEKELISKAEKQARQMVQNLSQKLHCLQIEVETGVAERKKQEEYIHMLQNKCAKTKTELQEQKKCVQRLSVGFDEATQSPLRIFEEKRQKLAYAEVKLDYPERKVTKPDDQVLQTTTLTRYPTYTRQACAICLTNEKDLAFGCGHMSCRDCGSKIRKCHICRKKISNSIKLFHG